MNTRKNIFHVFNKALDGIDIFSSNKDYNRFLDTILITNNKNSGSPAWYFRDKTPIPDFGDKERLIDIYALSILPNHFHFLVGEKEDGSIAKFFQRLTSSCTRSFNQRNERKGPLFIGNYKSVLIKNDRQASHIFTYIHANPLDFLDKNWREGKLVNWQSAEKFLRRYRWSSLGAYINGTENSKIEKIINKDFASIYFKESKGHLLAIKNWSNLQSQELEI